MALLASSTRDIGLAEDALGDAFERALRTWPVTGVPDNPEGWLLTVARNRMRDLFASASTCATFKLFLDVELHPNKQSKAETRRLKILIMFEPIPLKFFVDFRSTFLGLYQPS